MIAQGMSFVPYAQQEFRTLQSCSTEAEKSGLHTFRFQQVEYHGCGFWRGAVIEG